MTLDRLWRPLLAIGGLGIVAGGPMHPGGTMAEMLADPAWVPSHLLVLIGFVAITLALLGFRRSDARSDSMRRWASLALYGTVFQTVEMVFHLAAVVDVERLVAGQATPVLSIHLAMALVAYPLFAALMIGAIIVGARTGELGLPWLAPLGVIGAAAHGLAPLLVLTFEVEQARILFPMIILFALWAILTAAWPRPRVARSTTVPAESS